MIICSLIILKSLLRGKGSIHVTISTDFSVAEDSNKDYLCDKESKDMIHNHRIINKKCWRGPLEVI